MKRTNTGVPVGMTTVGRWGRSTLSCQLCRSKKLRCDRSQPCSNCSSRKLRCDYAGSDPSSPQDGGIIHPVGDDGVIVHNQVAVGRGPLVSLPESDLNGILQRLQRLEHAVFDRAEGTAQSPQYRAIASGRDVYTGSPSVAGVAESPHSTFSAPWTSFCSRSLTVPSPSYSIDRANMSRYLPPKDQSIQLLDYFQKSLQPTFGVLHIPSIRDLIEQTYADILVGKEPNADAMLLLFAICASCALTWTPDLLERLNVTATDAKVAFRTYCDLFTTILDALSPPLAPSTVALEALLLLTHLLSNTDFRLDQVYTLQARALWMTRALQIHRLDTTKSRERRRAEGFDQIEVEVQRRIWWYMVSSDWLSAFSGGPLEGTYVYHPAQMKVDYPLNVDDEDITMDGEPTGLPLSVPTSTSHFIYRIRLAELCREAVDTLPSIALESQPTQYDVVLELHAKFQNYIQELSIHFRLDAASIEQSQNTCHGRPYIAWQRALLHFSFNTRLCRLHRPFHLEGLTDSRYSFARMTCSRSAQTVLELRRSLDAIGSSAGLRPALYCLVIQHVFMAAVILATDVSFDPSSPHVDTRKAEVLAACDMLEVSKRESVTAREYIELNLRKLRSLLKNTSKTQPHTIETNDPTASTRPGVSMAMPGSVRGTMGIPSSGLSNLGAYANGITAGGSPAGLGLSPSLGPLGPNQSISSPLADGNMVFQEGGAGSAGTMVVDGGYAGWNQVWTDFFDAAADLDLPQWNMLYDSMDSGLGPVY